MGEGVLRRRKKKLLTVSPLQPVILADGVPTKTDAAMDGARVSTCGNRGAYGVAGRDADEGQEDGREDGGEPWHVAS